MLATFFTIWTQNHANANNLLKAQTYLSVSYNHYEKVSTANTAFLLAYKSLTMDQCFPVKPVVKKVGSFICKYRRMEEAKMKV